MTKKADRLLQQSLTTGLQAGLQLGVMVDYKKHKPNLKMFSPKPQPPSKPTNTNKHWKNEMEISKCFRQSHSQTLISHYNSRLKLITKSVIQISKHFRQRGDPG